MHVCIIDMYVSYVGNDIFLCEGRRQADTHAGSIQEHVRTYLYVRL